ncbi:CDP-2,3-bis-(O-geranylgeranyl)-sn-glycerol synthase [Natranaeroarchaeum sulfidigenes]|uniref:CDP-archaeol synthase n=1 Tax=Natranaeroarchaeum sulfidigenes TaxID=2784880 RepID=A0A897MNL7_9EURY|nr:CDP-2,3-bis-(O-geranylgeranyl)-sn-glycerol synthase [Natranaeroarchaeum sulfidigenes]QSG01992.1 CDP-diglyceride synthetase [Natranaeroarchaeum sulfidigenes]
MNPLEIVVVAFWLMLPAYVPNNAAVLTGGGPPIDGGRTWNDKRVLGDGKTWRGTAGGILAGVGLGLLLNFLAESVSSAFAFTVPEFPLAALFALAAGAMLGDILASFLKRRTGRERGAAFPGIDQLDFVVVSLVLTALVATDWFIQWFTLPVILAVLILTPVLHVGTNIIAFKLGLKDEPW